jgi:hypothetical protein
MHELKQMGDIYSDDDNTMYLAFALRMPRRKLVQICGTSVRHRQRVPRVYQKALTRAEVRSRHSPLCSQHVRI